MGNKRFGKFRVLGASRLALNVANLYEKIVYFRVSSVNISSDLILYVLYLFYACFACAQIWYLIENMSSILTMSQVISVLQMFCIHRSFSDRHSLIVQAIDHLENIVNQRKYSHIVKILSTPSSMQWIFFFCLGRRSIAVSTYIIYSKCERSCSKVTKIFAIGSVLFVVGVTMPSILCPILYLIIGHPSPENWIRLPGIK